MTETVNPSAPVAIKLGRASISALGESVAQQLGFEPGDDLYGVVEAVGGRIEYGQVESDPSGSGSIEIFSEDNFVIRLALDTGTLRDRFTIAHELGHWVLHYLYRRQKLGDNIEHLLAARYGFGLEEREANWFAAAFLMPEAAFRRSFAEADGDLLALSRAFGVSPRAAGVRATSLGL